MLREAAQGLTGSFLQWELPGRWLCVCPDFCAGELKIFRAVGNFALEKNSSYLHFRSGCYRNQIWAYDGQTQSLHLSGRDRGAAENALQ